MSRFNRDLTSVVRERTVNRPAQIRMLEQVSRIRRCRLDRLHRRRTVFHLHSVVVGLAAKLPLRFNSQYRRSNPPKNSGAEMAIALTASATRSGPDSGRVTGYSEVTLGRCRAEAMIFKHGSSNVRIILAANP